jgi:phospholipid/cholesterol/gamma-HCH transport system substrate-binding protein
MDERVMQFRVGVLFLGTLILVAILLVLFGKMPTYIGTYPVRVEFENAVGISKGSPVRKNGMLIGRVSDLQLTPDDRNVLVTMDIQKDKTIFQDEECSIRRELMGDTAIVVERSSREGASHKRIDPAIPLPGKTSDDPTGLMKALADPINKVKSTGDALTAASAKLGAAADRVGDILNEKNQQRIEHLIDDTAKSMAVIRRGLGDENDQKSLAEALKQLPHTLTKLDNTFARAEEALTTLTKPTGEKGHEKSPVDRLVDTINEFSAPLPGRKDAPAVQIKQAIDNIDEITTIMAEVMERVKDRKGSLSKLLNDTELYDRLNRAARNIEQVSRELRPIVEDAGVFMDKAARHPGGILRDAVKPGIGIK